MNLLRLEKYKSTARPLAQEGGRETMRSSKWRADLEMARRMRAAGVPLELDDDNCGDRPPAKGLSIERNAEGMAEAIGDTSTAYVLDVFIVPNLPWPVEIASANLHLPWDDPHFQWIVDPSGNGGHDGMYSVPGTCLSYPRDQIINHFIGCGHALTQGRSLSGMLLGLGMDMPKTVLHGSEVPAFLCIFDQFGREYSAAMPLRAHRVRASGPKKSARKPLFSCPDPQVERVAKK